jgi:hypothetical protein
MVAAMPRQALLWLILNHESFRQNDLEKNDFFSVPLVPFCGCFLNRKYTRYTIFSRARYAQVARREAVRIHCALASCTRFSLGSLRSFVAIFELQDGRESFRQNDWG